MRVQASGDCAVEIGFAKRMQRLPEAFDVGGVGALPGRKIFEEPQCFCRVAGFQVRVGELSLRARCDVRQVAVTGDLDEPDERWRRIRNACDKFLERVGGGSGAGVEPERRATNPPGAWARVANSDSFARPSAASCISGQAVCGTAPGA